MEPEEYYKNVAVWYEMVKMMKNREVTLLGESHPVRCIKSHSVEILRKNLEKFGFFRNYRNVYYSLAILEDMPIFTFNNVEKKGQTHLFNQNFDEYFVGYDMGIDFDGHTGLPQAHEDCKVIKNNFDKYRVPYTVKFSGTRGFHIRVPFEALSSNVAEVISLVTLFSNEAKTVLDLTTLDSTIIDKRRVWKCEYSYDVKSGLIALPLSDAQFDNFSLSMVEPETVLKNVRERGIFMRTGSNDGFRRLMKDVFI